MNIISVSVEEGAMVDKKPCCEPCLCLLSSGVCLNKANPYLNSALDSVMGARSILESLIMYSCSKSLAHPSRWIAGIC